LNSSNECDEPTKKHRERVDLVAEERINLPVLGVVDVLADDAQEQALGELERELAARDVGVEDLRSAAQSRAV
jgi:hypothetical protein